MTFTCYGQFTAFEIFQKWYFEIEQAELEYELESWENEGGRSKN